MRLLSPQSSNAKLAKNSVFTKDWETSILYMAPANVADPKVNLCPGSTPGCRAACLNTAGRGAMNSVQAARIRKAKRFISFHEMFMQQLSADLEQLVKRQTRKGGKRQAVRLNGTTDISWEEQPIVRNGIRYPGVPQAFPELQFYDYTKVLVRLSRTQSINNYDLTFSASECTSDRVIKSVFAMGLNTAVVFESLPRSFLGMPVIDGTTHDMRFVDVAPVIVGLVPKGRARHDITGFVKSA